SLKCELDVEYAVGRLHFDTAEEYTAYARSVVAAESRRVELPRRAVFFAVRNPDDRVTARSSADLVEPLVASIAAKPSDWTVNSFIGEAATKQRLVTLMGETPPALLFTASHGVGLPAGDARQLPHQGALLCQDWPGPAEWLGEVPPEFYYSADDVASDARMHGLVTFHFACYGAGTPRFDEFSHYLPQARSAIAPHAFLARLPRKLLS